MPTVIIRSYEAKLRDHAAECRRLAELAWSMACRNHYAALYLAGTKRAGLDTLNPHLSVWERLTVATAEEIDSRDFLQIVRQEQLPATSRTIDQLESLIRDWLKREPLAWFAD